jgi:hypothetical protein
MRHTLCHNPADTQQRCSTILQPAYEGFRGRIVFEDYELCWVKVLVRRDFLKVFLRSRLFKGPDSQEVHRYSAVLYGQEGCYSWQADFAGWLRRKGRLYWLGAYLRHGPTSVEYLRLCLRPEFAKKGFPLEAV